MDIGQGVWLIIKIGLDLRLTQLNFKMKSITFNILKVFFILREFFEIVFIELISRNYYFKVVNYVNKI